ncbi:rab-like protein 2A isoform X5 [Phascolarctos cinereus]
MRTRWRGPSGSTKGSPGGASWRPSGVRRGQPLPLHSSGVVAAVPEAREARDARDAMAGEPARAGAGADAGPELDQEKYDAAENVKIICLGDSAVGKSKLMERFLMDGFQPQQLSTYALTLYKHTTTVDGKTILVDFWDTAGQERFQSMHASYYHKAHACIMVFDVQRKVTYKNLTTWYSELREFRPEIPCLVVANKIDADTNVTQKSFNFARRFALPLYFVSAADGTNVVKLFNDAIRLAVSYKQNSQDFMDEVLQELENFELEKKNR